MAFITVTSDTVWVDVNFGEYFSNPVYSAFKGEIDGEDCSYKRENIVTIWKDKEHAGLTWLVMKDSISRNQWPVTHDPSWHINNPDIPAFIISDIDGTTTWVDQNTFITHLKTLGK